MKINILLVFLHTLNTKQEHIIIAHIPRLLLKKFNFFSLTDTEKKPDENKFGRYCTFLLIDDDNHSNVLVSEKNKYYIKHGDNRSIYVNILNEFKDIKKSYKINVIDLTNNYYNIDKSGTKKHCTILLIDDINTSRIFISEKNMYYIRYDDDDCDETVYCKILSDLNCIESDRNDIENLNNNDGYKHDITLLVEESKIFICENLTC